jgi:hypothetical protein
MDAPCYRLTLRAAALGVTLHTKPLTVRVALPIVLEARALGVAVEIFGPDGAPLTALLTDRDSD